MEKGESVVAMMDDVLAALDGSTEEVRRKVAALPAPDVAACLMSEVAARLKLQPSPGQRVPGLIRWRAGAATIQHAFTVLNENGLSLDAEGATSPDIVIEQDLWEAARALFGPRQQPADSTRTVWIMNEPGPETDAADDPWVLRLRAATRAADALVRCFDRPQRDIDALACHFGSDKWGDHFYTSLYEHHFERFKNEKVRLLEIGIGGFDSPHEGGESLRIWKHYFPRGQIVGLDIFDKRNLAEDRVSIVQGDQSDRAFLMELVRTHGPFDIVIDDGSHISSHVIASFETLFPCMAEGGLYVIEDLQTAYWPGWNGGTSDRQSTVTTTGYLKQLVDAIHYLDQIEPLPEPLASIGENVRALHLYRNLALIEKGLNRDQAAPSWVRRLQNDMDLDPPGSMRRIADT